jgi:hypothetical protein
MKVYLPKVGDICRRAAIGKVGEMAVTVVKRWHHNGKFFSGWKFHVRDEGGLSGTPTRVISCRLGA